MFIIIIQNKVIHFRLHIRIYSITFVVYNNLILWTNTEYSSS